MRVSYWPLLLLLLTPRLSADAVQLVHLQQVEVDERTLIVCAAQLDEALPATDTWTPHTELPVARQPESGLLELRGPTQVPVRRFRMQPTAPQFCTELPLAGLAPGTYSIQWLNSTGEPRSRARAVQLYAPTDTPLVITSDIDRTYLVSDTHGLANMVRFFRAPARDRQPIPGMPAVYRALQQATSPPRALRFISGSPTLLNDTLQARTELDGLHVEHIHLKPYLETIQRELKTPVYGSPSAALRHQIPYKVSILLHNRLRLPVGASELLLGDDMEYDHLVYQLYQDALSPAWSLERWQQALTEQGVPPSEQARLVTLVDAVRRRLDGKPATVYAFIRHVHPTNPAPTLPNIVVHGTTLELADALITRQLLPPAARDAIAVEVQGAQPTRDSLTEAAHP